MPTVLTGARILTPDDEIEGGSVIVEDGRIAEVAPGLSVPAGAGVVDLRGLTLVPGFIDIHVHGGGGFSLATRDAEGARSYARWVVAHGVTSFVASIVGETPEDGEAALRAIAEAGPAEGGAELLGAHLEGPFVSPEGRGACGLSRWPRSCPAPSPCWSRRCAPAASSPWATATLRTRRRATRSRGATVP